MAIDTKDPAIAAAIDELRQERIKNAPTATEAARAEVKSAIREAEYKKEQAIKDLSAGNYAYWALFYYFILLGITLWYGSVHSRDPENGEHFVGLVAVTVIATFPALIFGVMAAFKFFLYQPVTRGRIRECDRKLALLRGDPIEEKPEGSLIGATIGVFLVFLAIIGLFLCPYFIWGSKP